jgi:hypothetical protein
MPLPVSLREFVDEMDMFCDGSVFLHRHTGEFLSVSDDDLAAADHEDKASLPEWQKKVLSKIREAMKSDDWLSLPSKFDLDEYRIMRDFCCTIPDEILREDLLDTIGGRGTFGRYKAMLHRHNLRDRWYKFREDALREIAVEWLEAHDIPYGD